MAKYDSQLTELKTLLPTSKNILIALSANANIDTLSAGLALFLILEGAGKQVSIISETEVKVSESYLFGIDHLQKNAPSTDGGNLTLTLEGVAASDNTIPALEKLDWYAENNNLNLVFHVLSGQTFQPTRIVPHYQGSGFNLIFVIGSANLTSLGNIYQTNSQIFSGTHIVNIDTQTLNTSFGQTNVLDTNASSVSEAVSSVITDLGFVLDSDSASNLLAGIFAATNNLTNEKANAETYSAVANCLRAGGRKPEVAKAATPTYDWNALVSKPLAPQVSTVAQQQVDAGDDSQQPSPEERPVEEGVVSENIEPEWLTPKIFKGSSLG